MAATQWEHAKSRAKEFSHMHGGFVGASKVMKERCSRREEVGGRMGGQEGRGEKGEKGHGEEEGEAKRKGGEQEIEEIEEDISQRCEALSAHELKGMAEECKGGVLRATDEEMGACAAHFRTSSSSSNSVSSISNISSSNTSSSQTNTSSVSSDAAASTSEDVIKVTTKEAIKEVTKDASIGAWRCLEMQLWVEANGAVRMFGERCLLFPSEGMASKGGSRYQSTTMSSSTSNNNEDEDEADSGSSGSGSAQRGIERGDGSMKKQQQDVLVGERCSIIESPRSRYLVWHAEDGYGLRGPTLQKALQCRTAGKKKRVSCDWLVVGSFACCWEFCCSFCGLTVHTQANNSDVYLKLIFLCFFGVGGCGRPVEYFS